MTNSLVFIGNYGNRNVGDDAILYILSRRYRKKYPNYKQYVFARHYLDDIYKISSAIPLEVSLKSILKVLICSKIIVIGGGGIFSSYTGPIAKLIPIFAILNKLIGKKIIYESVGIYSTASLFEKLFLYISIIIADKVNVRDQSSYECLLPIHRFKRIIVVQDPGLEITKVHHRRIKEILRDEGIKFNSKLVGFSIKQVHNNSLNEKLKINILETIEKLVKKNINVILIPFCHDKLQDTEKDHILAGIIFNSLKSKKNVYVLRKYYHPKEIMGIMNLCDVFVGMRFHSLIFAHLLNIPLVPISYELKCLDFINKNNYKYIDIEKIHNADIFNEITCILFKK